MIDLDKAGAWSAVEQLEIAELLRNPTDEMADIGQRALGFGLSMKGVFKVMIDAATGGESDDV